MQPEARLVKRIKLLVEGRGGRCFKIHGGETVFQESGIPDLLCCYRGRFVGLEVKVPGGRPSRIQQTILKEISAAGGVSAVVETLEEVQDLLAKIEEEGDE